jgi:hypothetical protein
MTEYEIADLAVSTQELIWLQVQVLQGAPGASIQHP